MESLLSTVMPFAVGCCSGMVATICIQPIDTVKVRMQLMDQSNGRTSPWSVTRSAVARDGILNLYQGLSAGLLRQLVYGTLRLGLFSTFDQRLEQRARQQGTTYGFGNRALAGLSAGAMAALVGTPTEVALIQMQADSMRPVAQRRNYSSALDALWRIANKEGVLSLWKGAASTIIRAMSTNFGQLAFFSESKHQISKYSSMSEPKRTALAALIAGFTGAFFSLPFDFVKTRLQNQSLSGISVGLPMYSGTLDCFAKVVRKEGALRFYRDFLPYFLRVAPHSMIALCLADWLNEAISKRQGSKS
ncbi:mitochondrial dicarboxylate carrier protein [Dactylonectria estremocensis]|uniref:Mitochondrial dicarboxylate carrier protein n=1 Tax=Dactylonectria estremocensis TaxID=1079267 RepID=A0A9P9ESR2_9HYPO|nr:mitochondrial dicarboxylate carrier protein [Dactylonectria estremocensis]